MTGKHPNIKVPAMTEPVQTDNYTLSDHLNTIIEHCGQGLIDYCIYDAGNVMLYRSISKEIARYLWNI